MSEHAAVLLEEAVTALAIKADGHYIDGTFGRGGHSVAILSQLGPGGTLSAIDRDPSAVASAKEQFGADPRFSIYHASFDRLQDLCRSHSLSGRVDGILLDLGVSSPQLDHAERGFSFANDGPLDMRMNTSTGETARDWLACASADDIASVLWRYGEERHSRRIARAIVEARAQKPLETTHQLAHLIESVLPRRRPSARRQKHPATRSFQAIRIHINDELGQVERVLPQALQTLTLGGRLVVISFHSLEDRMVKRFMRDNERGPRMPREVPVQGRVHGPLQVVQRAQRASAVELEANPRSRSAVLRVAEKRQPSSRIGAVL